MKTRKHQTAHGKSDRRKLAAARPIAQKFVDGLKPFAECVEVLRNVFATAPMDRETTKALCLAKAALLYAAVHQPKDFPPLVEMIQRNHGIFHPKRSATNVCDLRERFAASAQRPSS